MILFPVDRCTHRNLDLFAGNGILANDASKIGFLATICLIAFFPIILFGCGKSSKNVNTAVAPSRFGLSQIRVNGKTVDLSGPIQFEKGVEYSLIFGVKNSGKVVNPKTGVLRMVKEGVIIQSASFKLARTSSTDFSVPLKFRIPADAPVGKVSLVLKDKDGLIVEAVGEVH